MFSRFRNQLILSWLDPELDASMNTPKLHQGGLQGGACLSRDDFTAPRGVTVTSTIGTGWREMPVTAPHTTGAR